MEIAKVNGVELEYEVVGTGEPVLLISPVLADGFLPLIAEPELASRYQLIRYHKRGWVGSTHTDAAGERRRPRHRRCRTPRSSRCAARSRRGPLQRRGGRGPAGARRPRDRQDADPLELSLVPVQRPFVEGRIKPQIRGVANSLDRLRRTDEAAAEAWNEREDARHHRCRSVIDRLAAEGLLSSEWPSAAAADLLWSATSLRSWEDLVGQRGWSTKKWVTRTVALLETTLIGGAT